MMSSVFPVSTVATASSSIGPLSNGDASNSRFENELYVAYLQARSRSIAVSSAGLLDWAQEIAVSEGYYDRDEAKTVLSAEWLDGWCQRYNVNDVDAAEEGDEDGDEEGDEEEDAAVESSSLVLYPPPIDSPLTPSPPPQPSAKNRGTGTGKKPSATNPSADANNNASSTSAANDIESVVTNYLSTPAPRSRLFEHILAESAGRVLMKFMNETLHLGDDVRPEHLPPDELNRTLVQFFRQIYKPGGTSEPYSVKVLHGILEGLSRYLRGCGYSCDLAYESNFSEARGAFGERLTKAFELESRQRHLANRANSDEEGDDDVDNEEVRKKMVKEHRLRPLGIDEIAPDAAMASFNKNTQKVMTWAAKNVVAFGRERLGLAQFTRVEEMPPELLNIVLTRFFCESRKADGTEFGWNSFKSVFSNLEAYLRVHRYPLGLHDPVFKMAKQTLFNVLRPGGGGGGGSSGGGGAAGKADNASSTCVSASSNSNRIGNSGGGGGNSATNGANNTSNNSGSGNAGNSQNPDGSSANRPHLYHRPIEINSTEENVLWSQGAFGWHSPQAINTTLYYYMRHIYGVRSGESHRRINFGDLRTMRTDDGREEFLVYTKAAAGVDMSRLRRMWATRDDRCIVRVYKVMVAKRPPETRKPDAPLYLQPKRQLHYVLGSSAQSLDSAALPTADESTSADCWFTTAPLGKNALATLMREAYQSCGLDSSRFNTNTNPGANNRGFASHSSLNGRSGNNEDGYPDDDMDNLLADSNNSNIGDDDGPAGSSSRSSSSFSNTNNIQQSGATQNQQPTSLVIANSRQTKSPATANSSSNNNNNNNGNNSRRPFMSPSANNNVQQTQNQAIDLASPNNRKRDNLGRFMGTGVSPSYNNSSSSLGSQQSSGQQQEALSLCTTGKNNSRLQAPASTTGTTGGSTSRLTNSSTNNNNSSTDLSFKPKIAKLSQESVKTEPNGGRSRPLVQNNSPTLPSSSDHQCDDSPTALSASAFGNGVGNMSISMQPKTAADMADVIGFLNQFLNSLNNNNNNGSSNAGSIYKCSINVTVNISK